MKKEIIFKSEMNLEPEKYTVSEVDIEKDLGVDEIEEIPDVDAQEQFEITQIKQKEAAREKVAVIFIIAFFIFLSFAILVGYLTDTEKIKNITDMILAISGVLAGPLGFIIGYYFKSKEE